MKFIFSIVLTLSVLLTACGINPPSTLSDGWQDQYDLGIRYLSDGNYQEAIIAFSTAIEIDPQNPTAYLGRADAYIASGETEGNLFAAQADYETALKLDEKLNEAYMKLADIHLIKGEQDAAYEILEQGYKVTQAEEIQNRIDEMQKENVNETNILFENLLMYPMKSVFSP